MNDREKLDNLKCVLDTLIITYKSEVSISEKLINKAKETKDDGEYIKSVIESNIFEEKLELLEYIRGFI